MSSLRLALKQSLQETGHLAPKEKKKKGSALQQSRRRKRQPGDPPRKRGRPPKHPRPPVEDEHESEEEQERETGNHHSDTENEFSYESESHDEEEDEEEDEEDDDDTQHAEHEEASRPSLPEYGGEGDDATDDEEDIRTGGDVEARQQKKIKKHAHIEVEPVTAALTASDEEKKKQRKLKRQLKHSAANVIQSQWKKKKEQSNPQQAAAEEPSMAHRKSPDPSTANFSADSTTKPKTSPAKENGNFNSSHSTRKKRDSDPNSSNVSKSKTVPPPDPEILEWARTMSDKKCRRHIATGLRVKVRSTGCINLVSKPQRLLNKFLPMKVRFATKVKRDGKVIKKKKWYGGRVSAVSKEGSKIKIKYDDGTTEITKFPDKDVVVDEQFNGQHVVSAEKFLPPPSLLKTKESDDKSVDEAAKASEPATEGITNESVKQSSITVSESSVAGQKSPNRMELSTEESQSFTKIENADSPPKSDPVRDSLEPSISALDATPGSKVTGDQEAPLTAPVKTDHPGNSHDFGSPEEGELSPGLTFCRNPPAAQPNPVEVMGTKDVPTTFEKSPESEKAEVVVSPEILHEPATDSEVKNVPRVATPPIQKVSPSSRLRFFPDAINVSFASPTSGEDRLKVTEIIFPSFFGFSPFCSQSGMILFPCSSSFRGAAPQSALLFNLDPSSNG